LVEKVKNLNQQNTALEKVKNLSRQNELLGQELFRMKEDVFNVVSKRIT
jgi:hypothetical protein